MLTNGRVGFTFSEVQDSFRTSALRLAEVLRREACINKSRHPFGYLLLLVRETGLEPVRRNPHAPQTCASASSATLALDECYYT